jgi:predicted acetyltransferase
MEETILIKPSMDYAEEIAAYKKEFLGTSDRINGSSGLEDFDDLGEWIKELSLYEKPETLPQADLVTAEQFMLVRKSDKKVLGLIQFRHSLNAYLAEYGGHIGYSVCQSERRKGYAKNMLGLVLNKCRERGLEKVLLTCMSGNEASRKTILSLRGVYERTTWLEKEKVNMERYWISLCP